MSDGPDAMTVVRHVVDGEEHPAFLYLRPRRGERTDPSRALLLDGSRPRRGDYMECGTCGARILGNDAGGTVGLRYEEPS